MFQIMNKLFISKLVGIALIISAIGLLIFKAFSIPDLMHSTEAWLSQSDQSAYPLVFGVLVYELILLVSRALLGYALLVGKQLSVWVFCLLSALTFVSGWSGIILSVAAIVLRFYKGHHAVKT